MGDKRHGGHGGGEVEAPRVGHTELFELATQQHGVVSTRQLKTLGYSRSSAAKAHRAGRLRRVYRGVYAVGREGLDWKGRYMAAALAARPAVVSHYSAGHLGACFPTGRKQSPSPLRRAGGCGAGSGRIARRST